MSSNAGRGAGGLDEIADVAGQAGQRVVYHRRIRWADVRQAHGPFPGGGDFDEGGRALAGEPGPHCVLKHRAGEGGAPATAHPVGREHQRRAGAPGDGARVAEEDLGGRAAAPGARLGDRRRRRRGPGRKPVPSKAIFTLVTPFPGSQAPEPQPGDDAGPLGLTPNDAKDSSRPGHLARMIARVEAQGAST